MTTKQKKVLDYMIRWAEKQSNGNRLQIEALAKDGLNAMDNFGDAFFYALQEAGYSYRYVNDAAYGGERGGYSLKICMAIEQPFKDYFMKISTNKF